MKLNVRAFFSFIYTKNPLFDIMLKIFFWYCEVSHKCVCYKKWTNWFIFLLYERGLVLVNFFPFIALSNKTCYIFKICYNIYNDSKSNFLSKCCRAPSFDPGLVYNLLRNLEKILPYDNSDLFRLCPQYVMHPPVTEHVSLNSKSLCQKCGACVWGVQLTCTHTICFETVCLANLSLYFGENFNFYAQPSSSCFNTIARNVTI